MNHSLRLQVEWYWKYGIERLTATQLEDYAWHVEQVLMEIRQRKLELRPAGIRDTFTPEQLASQYDTKPR